MKCVICKKGRTKLGTATVTLDKDGATLVFKSVPARVCTICGEAYVEGDITERLLKSNPSDLALKKLRSARQVRLP